MNVTRRLAGLALMLGVSLLVLGAMPAAAQTAPAGGDPCAGPGQHYTVA